MASLQDICSQLMKPAKDLSQWNFPLGEVLSKYSDLLQKTNKVNFGEAALVIQNSTNVYVRRIEYLYDETTSFNQNILNETEKEEKQNVKPSRKSSKKMPINFGDFLPLDFEKEMGKNINMKNHRQEGKSLKLLNRRFTQLESNTLHSQLQIEMLDVHGEIVGKKYDFRCNQQITRSGMLVDELTPNDFIHSTSIAINEKKIMDTTENCPDISLDELENRLNDEEINQNLETVQDEHIQNVSTTEDGFQSSNDSGYLSINSPLNNSQNQEILDLTNANDQNCQDDCVDTTADFSDDEGIGNNVEDDQIQSEKRNDKDTTNKTAENNGNKEETSDKENVSSNNEAKAEMEISQSPEEPVKIQEKCSSKRAKNSTKENKKWEPIPFEEGIPNKLPKARKQFRLPCHIDLLKSKPARKRKIVAETTLNNSVVKFLQNEFEPPLKKLNMYSPSRPMFTPLKKEEIEEFQKSFDLNIRSTFDAYHYEIISTIMMGFHLDITKRDPHLDSPTSCTSIEDHRMLTPEPEISAPDSYTPPMSPDLPDTHEEEPVLTNSTKRDYKKILQKKMKEIFGKEDIRTDLEENVAKWHETIKPKLLEAEQKPAFHMHEYGSNILRTLSKSSNQRLPFKAIVEEKSQGEVARYFLASLQLANTYNIDINKGTNINDDIEVVLLSEDNYQEKCQVALGANISKFKDKKRKLNF